MFVNISNHPMSKWGNEQFVEAEFLGNGALKEIPFPNIPAGYDSGEVRKMATKFVAENKLYENPGVVMVQGEFTFFYFLTSILKVLGWKVVVGCSERKVKENDNGTKTVEFNFVQFREV